MTARRTLLGAASLRSAAVAVGLLLAPSIQAQEAPPGVQVGEHPVYSFRRPLFNGMGVSSLADLQGRPVLVQFWGRR